jgi:hypothetical protein
MGALLRDLERPNWIAPSVPEIILDPDAIPDQALHVFESVNYDVLPWIFDAYWVPIPEVVQLVPNVERVPWTDDQRLPH